MGKKTSPPLYDFYIPFCAMHANLYPSFISLVALSTPTTVDANCFFAIDLEYFTRTFS